MFPQFLEIGDVEVLIAGQRSLQRKPDRLGGYTLDLVNHLKQRHGICCTAADVVNLPGSDIQLRADFFKGTQQIINTEHVADLFTVPVDHERLTFQGRVNEVGQPTLVFVATLPSSCDAGHAEDHGGQAKNAAVIVDVLVGRALRTTVGRIEVQWLGLAYAFFIQGTIAPSGEDQLPAGEV